MRDRVLVGAVVVHLPDLFVSAGDLDVEDLGFGDALAAAAEPEDDLVGEAMGDLAGGVFAGVLAVLFGENLRELGILGVEEEAVADDLAALNAEVAEGDHRGRGWRFRPLLNVHLSGCAGAGLRQQALGDDVEDAGVGEVGVERRVEGALESLGLRSAELGLKSATAMRMLVTPVEVSVWKPSCARRARVQASRRDKTARRGTIGGSEEGLSLRTRHSV